MTTMRKSITFICFISVLMLSQHVWGAANEKTKNWLTLSNARLDSIVGNNFMHITADGFMKVIVSGEHYVTYNAVADAAQNTGKLVFGYVKPEEQMTFKFMVEPVQQGYKLTLTSARTLTKMVGTLGYYSLGTHGEEEIANTRLGAWTDQTVDFSAPTSEVPFCFKRYKRGIAYDLGQGACMSKFMLGYQVIPDAPTWKQSNDNVLVTVNHTEDTYVHWIDLNRYAQVTNEAFSGTVKHEAVGEDAKYVVWNEAHDRCYIIKPGIYQFRSYVDKQDGVYCSSDFSATNLVLTATANRAEQSHAQIFYMVDGALAQEVDKTNHIWEASLIGPTKNHSTEYVYAYDGNLKFESRTASALEYLPETENRVDLFHTLSFSGRDSVMASLGNKATSSCLRLILSNCQQNNLILTPIPETHNSSIHHQNRIV